MSKFTLKVEADNWMEALSRVTGVFEKRNIAIDSIKASDNAVGGSTLMITSVGDDSVHDAIRDLIGKASVRAYYVTDKAKLCSLR